jgi:hypothetical protein
VGEGLGVGLREGMGSNGEVKEEALFLGRGNRARGVNVRAGFDVPSRSKMPEG